MDGRKNNKGTKGNSGGRSYSNDFYHSLDKMYLPEACQYCYEIVLEARDSSDMPTRKLGVDAAKVLMSKAPNRTELQGDGLVIKLVNYGDNEGED